MLPLRSTVSFALAAALAGCASPTETASSESNLTAGATVRFTEGTWEPTWGGTPRAGGSLAVAYDFGRLPQCRNESSLDSWVIEVSWRFDGGPIETAALPGSPGTADTLPPDGIAIPPTARAIELWFSNHAVGGYDHCTAWDSQYGANYRHTIE